MILSSADIASIKQLSIGAKNLTVRQHLHLSKKFFALNHDAALQHELKIASIGTSSYVMNQNIYHDSNCMVKVFTKFVRSVDGKVKEMPAWYKKRYEHLIDKINYPKVCRCSRLLMFIMHS